MKKNQVVANNKINILGKRIGTEYDLLIKCLKDNHYDIYELSFNSSLDDFLASSNAYLNIVFSEVMLEFDQEMQDKLNISFINMVNDYRIEDTNNNYLQL